MVVARTPGQPTYADATWRTWGTYVFLGVADAELLEQARGLAEKLLAELDQAISRFRDDSDLVRANAAAGSWVDDVSPWLVEAVDVAVAAARDTGGLVDPTMGRLICDLGYDADLDEVRARPAPVAMGPADLPEPPLITGAWRRVTTAPGRVRVPTGSALDLGATGKAFAADRISAAIAEQVTDCILSIGGDVAVGCTSDDPARAHPWRVAVSERPGEDGQEIIALPRGGIATSTTRHRTWQRGGETLHHLLDPRTGRPIERIWRTATVRGPDCVGANVASTAVLVLGDRATGWLEARGMPARLVARDGDVVTLAGWPGPAR